MFKDTEDTESQVTQLHNCKKSDEDAPVDLPTDEESKEMQECLQDCCESTTPNVSKSN